MQALTSSATAAQRANQEDPLVMYLVVRESLGMGVGKTCAQVGHACQMLLLTYFNLSKGDRSDVVVVEGMEPHDLLQMEFEMRAWLDESFRKVALKADDKEWEKVKAAVAGRYVLVVDAGLTEIPSGSETVIGIWPMRKSERPKIIQRLQALK